jgi:Probable zinc-ribbon domain
MTMKSQPEGAVQPASPPEQLYDRILKCVECGGDFAFTTGEQRFFQERNFTQPRRCKDCRKKRRRDR